MSFGGRTSAFGEINELSDCVYIEHHLADALHRSRLAVYPVYRRSVRGLCAVCADASRRSRVSWNLHLVPR